MQTISEIQENSKTKVRSLTGPRKNVPDPFHTVAVNLVGPWLIAMEQSLWETQTHKQTIAFQSLTIINKGTDLLKIELYHLATLLKIAMLVNLEWLCCYP